MHGRRRGHELARTTARALRDADAFEPQRLHRRAATGCRSTVRRRGARPAARSRTSTMTRVCRPMRKRQDRRRRACLRSTPRPSKPWACRSRRCRRRTWRSSRACYEAVNARRPRGVRWTCSTPTSSAMIGRRCPSRSRRVSRPRGYASVARRFDEPGTSPVETAGGVRSTPAIRVVVSCHVSGRGRGSGVEVEPSSTHASWTVARRQDRRDGGASADRGRGPRSRRAVGVGDVAGERGDRASRLRERGTRRDMDAALRPAFTRNSSTTRAQTNPTRARTSVAMRTSGSFTDSLIRSPKSRSRYWS